jgi:general secretion pathway protein K
MRTQGAQGALHRRHDRGAAIITAMLIVTLATVVVSGLFWRQNTMVRSVENRLAMAQTRWIERAAVDYARLVLNQDRDLRVDHEGEIWGTPVQDTRLDETVTAGAKIDTDKTAAFLRGQIFDAQGRLNLNNLVTVEGRINGPEVAAFGKLLQLLGKSPGLSALLAARIQRSVTVSATGQAPALPTALPLKRLQDLALIPGFDQSTIDAVAPFVVFLPERNTPVNVNTAPAEVLAARMPDLSMSQARTMVDTRKRKPFQSVNELTALLRVQDTGRIARGPLQWGVTTRYFLLSGVIRYDRVESQTETLLFRRGQGRVEVQWQDRY